MGRKIGPSLSSDVFTREPLAIEMDTSLLRDARVEVLERARPGAGHAPKGVIVDNGPKGARPVGQ